MIDFTDIAQIYQRRAIEAAGTPEADEYLAHARRYLEAAQAAANAARYVWLRTAILSDDVSMVAKLEAVVDRPEGRNATAQEFDAAIDTARLELARLQQCKTVPPKTKPVKDLKSIRQSIIASALKEGK